LLAWHQAAGTADAFKYSRAGSIEGSIRVAAPADTSLQLLSPWFADYGAAHPGLRLTVLVGDRMHDVNREAVDLAIRYGDLADSRMVSRLLCRSERVLVAAPGYVARAGVPEHPLELMQHRCLAWLRRDQPQTQWSFRTAQGRTEHIVVKPSLSGDGALVRAWALEGAGIAYKARVDVDLDVRAGRLVQLLPDWQGESVPVNAVLPSGRYMPARVRSLLKFLSERYSGLSQP
jgi:DNA-binding transcriptional LysR family regulator